MKGKTSCGKLGCSHLFIFTVLLTFFFAILWNAFLGHSFRRVTFFPLFRFPNTSSIKSADFFRFPNTSSIKSADLFPNTSSIKSADLFPTTSSIKSADLENQTPCSSWYSQSTTSSILHLSRNPNVFLTLEGDWWHLPNIVSYNLPYGIKGNENLVRQILVKTKSNMPEKINGLVCKRCVVVGNGNTLRNSLLGEVINKYDVVIRLNNAPLRGYERDVGNKTTLRFFYPESATEDLSGENDPDMLFVLVPFKTADLLWLKELVYNKRGTRSGFWRSPPTIKKLDISKLRILSPFYLYQAMTELLRKADFAKRAAPYATTGFVAVSVALNYCDEVHLAGFGYPLTQKSGLIHYFDSLKMEFMFRSVHNVTSEDLFLRKLQKAEIIKYLT